MAVQAARAQDGDSLSSQSLAVPAEQGLLSDSPTMRDVQGEDGSDEEKGHEDAWKGCRCGSGPNLDGLMASRAWCTFRGLKGGLWDDGGDPEGALEPTFRDLKNAKDCVEHMFDAHKDRMEILPGTFLDRKEARGYLIAGHLGLGLLPSAQLAYDVGLQLTAQVTRAEKDAAAAAAAAKKKAARKKMAAGPGGPREQAAETAAAAVLARTTSLASLPKEHVAPPKKRARTKKPDQPTTPAAPPPTAESEAHRPVEDLQPEDRRTRFGAEGTESEAEAKVTRTARIGSSDWLDEVDAQAAQARAAQARRKMESRKMDYVKGWNDCVDETAAKWEKANAKWDRQREWYEYGIEQAERHVRVLERALRKAGLPYDLGEIEYDTHTSESECSECVSVRCL